MYLMGQYTFYSDFTFKSNTNTSFTWEWKIKDSKRISFRYLSIQTGKNDEWSEWTIGEDHVNNLIIELILASRS